MKRKLKRLAAVLIVLLLGFGTAVILWPRDRITAESLARIHIGMTEDDVEEILGGPGKRPPFETKQVVVKLGVPETSRFWIGRFGFIEIEFDNDDRVKDKYFRAVQPSELTLIDRIRDWFGW
jgi:hypothetical protein